ncbi:unnamed protein product, partial [Ectocarpus sp. 8 AP-2014]
RKGQKKGAGEKGRNGPGALGEGSDEAVLYLRGLPGLSADPDSREHLPWVPPQRVVSYSGQLRRSGSQLLRCRLLGQVLVCRVGLVSGTLLIARCGSCTTALVFVSPAFAQWLAAPRPFFGPSRTRYAVGSGSTVLKGGRCCSIQTHMHTTEVIGQRVSAVDAIQ